MNLNYSYRTTKHESILTEMYVFLVFFTIFAFYHEKILSKIAKNIFIPEILICVKCINCSYNNTARNIGLLDKFAIFVCTG